MKSLIALTLTLLTTGLTAQNYSEYDSLLKKYATPSGVKYKQWHSNKADQKTLDNILSNWSKIDATTLSKNDKAAFRINLYNAAMIDAVLSHYPVKSITKIDSVDFSIFKKNFIQTPSGKVSLDTIEKKQLLVDFPDARIHFAVNCASISCPPLRAEAFTGKKLEVQLKEQTQKFLASKEAIQIKGNTAHYSSLFNWYAKDFKITNPATYFNKFGKSKVSTNLKVQYLKYNWGLNIAQ